MKKNVIIICWLFLISQPLLMQTLSIEEKNKIINALNITTKDSMYTENYAPTAIELVIEHKINEAVNQIIINIWKQDPITRIRFLTALHVLSSSETEGLALSMIDSLNYSGFKNEIYSHLEVKLLVVKILFELGNYSHFQIVFDRINEDKDDISALMLLGEIIKNIPFQEVKAKNLLIDSSVNLQESYKRWYLCSLLNEIYGQELLPFYINRFKAEYDLANKNLILINVLSNYKSEEVRLALIERLTIETDAVLLLNICEQLLNNYNYPNSHLIVQDYLIHNPIFKFKNLLVTTLYSKPKFTFEGASFFMVLDTLISYINQSSNYKWLKDEGYKNQLLGKIQEAKNYLSSFDSVNCYKQIKSFQTSIQQVYSDSAGSFPKYVSKDAYKFLYYYPQYILERLPSPPTVKLENSQGKLLPDGSLQYYEGGWKPATNNGDGTFYLDTKLKTVSLRMTYEYGSQTKSNVTVGKDAIIFQTVNTKVKLFSSEGTPLDTGTVQYYAGGWRNFGKTVNGVATKELLAGNYSFRMTYAYASTDKSQNLDTNSTIVFTTKNTIVELRNSSGQLIDGGEVQYYSGGWRIFGTASGGISQKELLPNTYSFRMTYGYGSNDKQQNTDTNPIVVFNTIKADVELRDSRNNLLDQGVVQYYSGAWRDFGTTVNGVATKELLPNNYSFRMSYAYSSNDKQQNIGVDPTVVFQTVNAIVQLKNSLGNLIDQGTVQYYSGAWRDFGTTINGEVTKELLPNNYSFRMSYAFASNDKQQNIGTTPTVVFQTVNTSVELRNSQNNLMGEGVVQYYSGGWRTFGTTVGGIANLELLPNNYSFRMTHEYIALDKSQNTGTSNVVTFTTVQCRVLVRGNQNQPINNATVRYYAGAWRDFGTTINGEVTKELLPINLTLRAIVGTAQQDKTQNLLTNPLVEFIF